MRFHRRERRDRTVQARLRGAGAAAALALGLGAMAANAEPVDAWGVAVGVDLASSTILLDPAPILDIGPETKIIDEDRGRVVTLRELDLREGEREVPVRYQGDRRGNRVAVDTLRIGKSVD